MELKGDGELWGFRFDEGSERGRGGEVDFWEFSGVGVTEMSTNWSGVADVGDEEQSESKEDEVVGSEIAGDVAVAEDSMVHI